MAFDPRSIRKGTEAAPRKAGKSFYKSWKNGGRGMSKENNGGPAFPRAESENFNPQNGMSLRDYFAAKAMQGELSSQDESFTWKNETFRMLAKRSYEIADAMLEEREE